MSMNSYMKYCKYIFQSWSHLLFICFTTSVFRPYCFRAEYFLNLRRKGSKDGECDEYVMKLWDLASLISKADYFSQRANIRTPIPNGDFCSKQSLSDLVCIWTCEPRNVKRSTLPMRYPAITLNLLPHKRSYGYSSSYTFSKLYFTFYTNLTSGDLVLHRASYRAEFDHNTPF